MTAPLIDARYAVTIEPHPQPSSRLDGSAASRALSAATPVSRLRSGLSLFQLRPPYRERIPLASMEAAAREELPFGSVLGVEAYGTVLRWPELEATIHSLRSQAVTTPVVLMIDPQAEDLLFIATRVARLPVRAVLFRGEPIDGTLRRQITHPARLAEDVLEWLALRGIRLSPVTAELIRQIFARAPAHREIVPLLREVGNPESSARFRCRKKRLPSPGRWLHAARALGTALRMQAEPGRPLLRLAHELGYADHSALSNQMLRVFRLRPGEVRRVLGWEGLMDRWLSAEARKGRRSPTRRDRGGSR